ncbi:hypothetical protein C900_00518 [Fulvivirga imtechensis AK7]|uniref:Uncharacterized protein n=1 Tax=Fulvivirga imtechensis AK7 TaxID=1237149 RepID=L8JHP4_9BACT|nr:hypothetical protein C900_00518 [Fulvivirga imtechensis AK7]
MGPRNKKHGGSYAFYLNIVGREACPDTGEVGNRQKQLAKGKPEPR